MTKAWSILPDEWKPILKERGLRPFRADQILQALYRDWITDWDAATTLPKDFRETLKAEFPLVPPTVLERAKAEDGTEKLQGTGMTYQQMHEALRDACRQAAKQQNALLVPVGDAFRLCHDTRPEIGLYMPDHYHPSPEGTYLAACVFFAALSGRDPRTLDGIPDIAPDTAATLRSIARDTLQGSTKEDFACATY